MTCRIDHTISDTIPAYFCRGCHPELIRPEVELQRLAAKDTAERHAAEAAQRRTREIETLRGKIARMKERAPLPDSVPAKILVSLERKLIKLEVQS